MIISDFNCAGARDHKRAAKNLQKTLLSCDVSILKSASPGFFRDLVARAHGASSWDSAWNHAPLEEMSILRQAFDDVVGRVSIEDALAPASAQRCLVFGGNQPTGHVLGEAIHRAALAGRRVHVYVDPSRQEVWEACHALAAADPNQRILVIDLPPVGAARKNAWTKSSWHNVPEGLLCDLVVAAVDFSVSEEMVDAIDRATKAGCGVVCAYRDYVHMRSPQKAVSSDIFSIPMSDPLMNRLFSDGRKVFLPLEPLNRSLERRMTVIQGDALINLAPPIGHAWTTWMKETKRLAAAIADGVWEESPTLSRAQKLLARMRGYADWHALEQSWGYAIQ
jgi:hypothetical protein